MKYTESGPIPISGHCYALTNSHNNTKTCEQHPLFRIPSLGIGWNMA